MERPRKRTSGIVALPGGASDEAVPPLRRSQPGRAELVQRIVELGSTPHRDAAHAALVASPDEVASLCRLALRDFVTAAEHRAAILAVLTRRPLAEARAAVGGELLRWAELLTPREWLAHAAWFARLGDPGATG